MGIGWLLVFTVLAPVVCLGLVLWLGWLEETMTNGERPGGARGRERTTRPTQEWVPPASRQPEKVGPPSGGRS